MAQLNIHIKLFYKEQQFIEVGLQEFLTICSGKKSTRIALSGGSSPKNLYNAIANSEDISLKNTTLYQVDERYVPAHHPDSNHRLIKNTILSNSKNQPKRFHYFDTSLSMEKCLKQYEAELPDSPFDLTILGIGHDGHIASLFPNSPALKEKKSKVANTKTRKFAIYNRLTLTYPPILHSKKILILLKGTQKQKVLAELLYGKKKRFNYPAKELLKHPNLNIFQLM